MSRLLHAAARGARIQLFNKWCGKWDTVGMVTIAAQGDTFRIRPKDAHLGYGPISTALRNDASGLEVTDSCWFTTLSVHSDGPVELMTDHERTLFLLFTAEALADEGL